MADFKQAIEWLKAGKKVKRLSTRNKEWYLFVSEKRGEGGFIYLHHTTLIVPLIHKFNLELFEATDFEIYCEKHDWIVTPLMQSRSTKRCVNCGKKEVLELKESLSDKRKDIAPEINQSQWGYSEKNVQEKIKNLKRR